MKRTHTYKTALAVAKDFLRLADQNRLARLIDAPGVPRAYESIPGRDRLSDVELVPAIRQGQTKHGRKGG